jgi:hypothetical protein
MSVPTFGNVSQLVQQLKGHAQSAQVITQQPVLSVKKGK